MSDASGAAGDATDRPLAPLISGLGLLLLAAALTARCLTTGGGFELLRPGAQLLLDALVLSGAAATLLARGLLGVGPSAPRAVLAGSGVMALLLLVGALRASHADLAWRTALSWGALLLLALAVHDLGRERAAGRALSALVVALAVCAAGLALEERFVSRPATLAQYERGELEAELGPMDASYRQSLDERVRSPEAAGPFLLPALLACATAMALPLLLVAAWDRRRQPALATGLALCALVLLGGFLQAKSKGGALALLAALGGLALLHPRLAPWRARLLLALTALGGALLAVGLVLWWRNPEAEGVGLSLAVRLEYWSAGLGMARDHPLLGVGLNQFRELYGEYKATRAEETLHAHSAPVQLLAELGVVGLLAALGLLAAWARAGLAGLDAVPGTAELARPGDGRALGWTLGGLGLGSVFVGRFGDVYDFDATPWHLRVGALALAAVTVLVAKALERVPPRLAAAALLGGSCAFLADGLLDFGLHHAGTATLAAAVVGLGAAVGRAPVAASPRGRVASLAVGGVAGALAIGLLVGIVRPGLDADLERQAGNERYLEASLGGPRTAELLVEAAARLEAATEGYPWHARTWLERAAAEAALGRSDVAVECARRATERAPRWASAWSELGALLRARGDARGALEALERAAALYPGDPTHALTLGLARAETAADEAARSSAEAALERALDNDAAVRQLSKRLTASQLVALGRALLDVAGTEAGRARAREALRRAAAMDDAARADREAAVRAGRRPLPDARRELTDEERRALGSASGPP